MPPVFAQMRGDAVRARRLANARGFDRIRLAKSAPAITRLADRGDVVNVDAELEHNAKMIFPSDAVSCQKRRGLANSIAILIAARAESCFLSACQNSSHS